MKLNEHYTLEAYDTGWTLKYEKEGDADPETGKRPVTKNQTYHTTIQQALHKWADSTLAHNMSVEGVALIGIVDKLHKRIDELENINP